jgi:hypothetical protein
MIWGEATLASVDSASLCDAMALAYLLPKWVVTWNADYGTMQAFYQFLRRYPGLPGIEVASGRRAELPAPYGETLRVYRLRYSDAILALDRRPSSVRSSCP